MLISFAWTTDALLQRKKTVTRRDWSDKYAAQWCKAWDDQRLIHQAWDKSPRVPGARQLGEIVLTHRPYQERVGDMPEYDLAAEGGLWESKEEFIRLLGGNPDKVLWVVRFVLLHGGAKMKRDEKVALIHKLKRQTRLRGSEIADILGFPTKEVYRILDRTSPHLPPEERFRFDFAPGTEQLQELVKQGCGGDRR